MCNKVGVHVQSFPGLRGPLRVRAGNTAAVQEETPTLAQEDRFVL